MLKGLYFLFIIIALLLTGCASQQDLNTLRWEVNALETRLTKVEQGAHKISEALSQKDKELDQSLKQQADLQAQYTDLYTQLLAIQGKIEEMGSPHGKAGSFGEDEALKAILNDINAIKRHLGMIEGGKSLYEAGLERFREAKYDDAIKLFDLYLKKDPQKSLIDNVHFWTGEALYAQGKFEDAILRYDIVIKKFKDSEKVPNCLLKQGMSFIKLNDRQTGELLLRRVTNEFPDSKAAEKAKEQLKKN